jgi:hypothetical protein
MVRRLLRVAADGAPHGQADAARQATGCRRRRSRRAARGRRGRAALADSGRCRPRARHTEAPARRAHDHDGERARRLRRPPLGACVTERASIRRVDSRRGRSGRPQANRWLRQSLPASSRGRGVAPGGIAVRDADGRGTTGFRRQGAGQHRVGGSDPPAAQSLRPFRGQIDDDRRRCSTCNRKARNPQVG